MNTNKFFAILAVSASFLLTVSAAFAQSDPYFPELDAVTSVMRNGSGTGETLMFKVRSGPDENIEKPEILETAREENISPAKKTGETEAIYEKHSIHKLFRKNPLSGNEDFDPWNIPKPEFSVNRPAANENVELPPAIENKKTDIKKIIKNDNLETFARVVKTEADIDRRYDGQNTALMLCCDKRADRIFDYLLRRNADVNLKNAEGTTAVMIAASRGYVDMIEKLIKKTADINAISNDGNNALILAARKGNEAVCSVLLKNGANVNAKNGEGYSAWRYAVERNNQRLAVLLVTSGAEVDQEFEKKMAIKFKSTAVMGGTIKPEKPPSKSPFARPAAADDQKNNKDKK